MARATKLNTLIIKAGKGFFYNGVISEGGQIMEPYKPCGTIFRILREICFRIPLLPKSYWYCKEVQDKEWLYIFVFDPLITKHYLNWLKARFPNSKMNYLYGNMVGKARHITPQEVPEGIKVWSYDEGDCQKYGMTLYHYPYFKVFLKPLKTPKYDVMFVGADKGRAEYLIELEKKMNDAGLKTKFIITKQGKFDRNKKIYQRPISYDELTNIVSESRAILNVVMPNQTGVTMRDIESMLFGVKLITTNATIEEKDFFNPNNIYRLDGTKIDGLMDFMSKPLVPVPQEIKNRYTLDSFVTYIGGGNE